MPFTVSLRQPTHGGDRVLCCFSVRRHDIFSFVGQLTKSRPPNSRIKECKFFILRRRAAHHMTTLKSATVSLREPPAGVPNRSARRPRVRASAAAPPCWQLERSGPTFAGKPPEHPTTGGAPQGIECMISRSKNCYDKAAAGRLFRSLKHEWTRHYFHWLAGCILRCPEEMHSLNDIREGPWITRCDRCGLRCQRWHWFAGLPIMVLRACRVG